MRDDPVGGSGDEVAARARDVAHGYDHRLAAAGAPATPRAGSHPRPRRSRPVLSMRKMIALTSSSSAARRKARAMLSDPMEWRPVKAPSAAAPAVDRTKAIDQRHGGRFAVLGFKPVTVTGQGQKRDVGAQRYRGLPCSLRRDRAVRPPVSPPAPPWPGKVLAASVPAPRHRIGRGPPRSPPSTAPSGTSRIRLSACRWAAVKPLSVKRSLIPLYSSRWLTRYRTSSFSSVPLRK